MLGISFMSMSDACMSSYCRAEVVDKHFIGWHLIAFFLSPPAFSSYPPLPLLILSYMWCPARYAPCRYLLQPTQTGENNCNRLVNKVAGWPLTKSQFKMWAHFLAPLGAFYATLRQYTSSKGSKFTEMCLGSGKTPPEAIWLTRLLYLYHIVFAFMHTGKKVLYLCYKSVF